ncbi:hypothetical protein FM104_00380 [Microbacterium esteraromaticum]|uniref:Uncharacterized protein n=1 Tax=Microbacterium esteraromaticum TaxID=57043 RepID=A0A1R4I7A5_9MICO|nr:hypothetical protein [Microbacterium esteraromaticum]SJN15566.1 hypothetical protein FM104_00380 [Microbacterium esteraromaticum]
MNDEQHTIRLREHPASRPEKSEAPDEARRAGDGEASELARHGDPSLSKKTTDPARAGMRRPGAEWVRPTDLLASRMGRVAGRGIDFQSELARRARRVPGQAYQGTRTAARSGGRVMSERARKLPPVSAFGRGTREQFSWVSRSGIGLG